MTVIKTQVCSKCGRSLPLTAEHYHRDKHKPAGFRPDCKDCSKKRWKENKDRYNARAREYYRENIEYYKNRTQKNQKPSRKERKRRAVSRLGGACECCGLKGPITILQFHHRDPKTKLGGWNWMVSQSEELRNAELDKCSLLCANCHSGYHTGFVEYDEWSGYRWKHALEYD